MSRKHYKLLMPVAAAAILLALTGCAGLRVTANYGKIVPSGEVTQAFERYELNPNFNYFISGPELYPNALIALDRSYALEPDIWRRMEFTPQTFRTQIIDMQSIAFRIRDFQHGFAILDDKGRPIGVWYSLLSATTWVKMAGDKTVVMPPPPLGVYEQRERESFMTPPKGR